MESSRRSSPPDAAGVAAAVAAALDALPAPGPVAIALSGGRDSIALLHAVATLAPPRQRPVAAVHVHHGLSPHADAWAEFCVATCAAYGVPCAVRRVDVGRGPRTSLEAEARSARYAALAEAGVAAGACAVLLAHHRDDQAETLLLQLLRGAGPHGLAAMPAQRLAHGIAWLRPLLGISRAAIDAHVRAHGLRFVDDHSNGDTRRARNAVRHVVAPALAAVAPAYAATLARAATLQAYAARLADDLAAHDARGAVDGATLSQAALAALPEHRARNLLRWFLRECGLPPPSHARLRAMLAALTTQRADARAGVAHGGAAIGVHRGRIVVHAPPPAPFDSPWRGEPLLLLPHGRLAFVGGAAGGLDPRRLDGAPVTVRARRGGERLTLGPGRPRRALKSLLQDAGLATWERAALPLVFCGDALAAVPGIGVDVAFQAAPGSDGLALRWTPTAGFG